MFQSEMIRIWRYQIKLKKLIQNLQKKDLADFAEIDFSNSIWVNRFK